MKGQGRKSYYIEIPLGLLKKSFVCLSVNLSALRG